jgi:hypothetical protein
MALCNWSHYENCTPDAGQPGDSRSRCQVARFVERPRAFYCRCYVWLHCAIVLVAGLDVIGGEIVPSIVPRIVVDPLRFVVWLPVPLVGPAFLVSFLMLCTAVHRRDQRLLLAGMADLFVSTGQLFVALPAVQ